MKTSLNLSDQDDWFRMDCVHCKIFGSYSRDALLKKFGDMPLPDLCPRIAKLEGCVRADNFGHLERCGIRYKDLVR